MIVSLKGVRISDNYITLTHKDCPVNLGLETTSVAEGASWPVGIGVFYSNKNRVINLYILSGIASYTTQKKMQKFALENLKQNVEIQSTELQVTKNAFGSEVVKVLLERINS